MKKSISIYLAGPIQKGHEKFDHLWTKETKTFLVTALKPIETSLLDPAERTDDLSDQLSVFGRDMMQVYCSNFIFVYARDRCGLGVGAEMMWAKFHKIPVITLAPRNSHYNKSETTLLGVPVHNWVHPFVESLSDAVVETIAEGAKWIKTYLTDQSISIKGIESIESAMLHYHESQFQKDKQMRDLVLNNKELENRIKSLLMITN